MLFHAPAGFGKTTLARQWLSRSNRAAAWHNCARGGSDVASLASRLINAIATVADLDTTSILERVRRSPDASLEAETLAGLISEQLRTWEPDRWLVLDDYDRLTHLPASEEFVESLLSQSAMNAIVLTRTRPRWASARRLIYGEIFELDGATLAMTKTEMLEVFSAFGVENGERLSDSADGWPAVVGLLARTPNLHIRRGGALRHFIADEICRGLDEGVLNFFAVVSALSPFDVGRIEASVGPDLCSSAVTEGLRRGVLLDLGDGCLEVHTVLRDFFRYSARRDRKAETLVREVGAALLKERAWDDVFTLAQAFEDSQLYEALLREGLPDALDEGMASSVRAWVEFGRERDLRGPELMAAEAELALRDGYFIRAEALARSAVGSHQVGGALKTRALIIAGRAAHLAGDEAAAVRHYRAARARSNGAERRQAAWGELAAATDLESDDSWRLLRNLERSHDGTAHEQVRLACSALLLSLRFGNFAALSRAGAASELVDLVDDPYLRTAFRNVYGYACAIAGHHDVATEQLRLLDDDVDRMRLRFVKPYASLGRAVVSLGLGEFDRAFEQLDIACDDARGHDPYVAVSAAAIRARGLIGLGHFHDALDFTSIQTGTVTRSMLGELKATQGLALACLGRLKESVAACKEARALSRAVEIPFLCSGADAVISLVRGNQADTDALAERLIRNAHELPYVDGLLAVVRGCPELGRLMARSSDHREWLRHVLTQSGDAKLVKLLGFGTHRGAENQVLSRREAEVLALLTEGLTNRQMAERLFISEATVKVHVHRICEKLGVRNRTEAAVLGGRQIYATSATTDSAADASS
jgi:DNA-binding CsgD family transcriptional regulator